MYCEPTRTVLGPLIMGSHVQTLISCEHLDFRRPALCKVYFKGVTSGASGMILVLEKASDKSNQNFCFTHFPLLHDLFIN